jgi:tetratricopeptide (TPR) repeat protein
MKRRNELDANVSVARRWRAGLSAPDLLLLFLGLFLGLCLTTWSGLAFPAGTDPVAKGWHYYKRGEYDTALRQFKAAAEANPRDSKALSGWGWCLYRMRKDGEAEEVFQKILEENPRYPSALRGLAAIRRRRYGTLNLAWQLYGRGDYDHALLLFREILGKTGERQPREQIWRARLGEGWCLYWMGRFEKAAMSFQAVLKEREGESGALQGLGYSLYRQGEYRRALEPLTRLREAYPAWFEVADNAAWCHLKLGELEKAREAFEKALSLRGNCADTYAGLAWCFQKKGNREKAVQNFLSAIALDPRYVEDDAFFELLAKEKDGADLWIALGEAYRVRREFESALLRFREALRQRPKDLKARMGLARARIALGQYDKAVEALKDLSKREPRGGNGDWRRARETLGWAYYYMGEYDKAYAIFKKLRHESGMGWCLLRKDKIKEAEREFREALKVHPGDPSASSGLKELERLRRIRLDRAWKMYYRGDYPGALGAFQAIRTNRRRLLRIADFWEIYCGIGWCYLKIEKHDKALSAFKRALDLSLKGKHAASASGRVHTGLAWTYYGMGLYAQAAREFKKGLRALPYSIELYRGLGWSHLRQGEPGAALRAFKKGLALQPGDPGCRSGVLQIKKETGKGEGK